MTVVVVVMMLEKLIATLPKKRKTDHPTYKNDTLLEWRHPSNNNIIITTTKNKNNQTTNKYPQQKQNLDRTTKTKQQENLIKHNVYFVYLSVHGEHKRWTNSVLRTETKEAFITCLSPRP